MNLIELNRALRQLRLGGIAAVLETRLHQAQTEAMPPIDFLSCLVADELTRRGDRLLERRTKQAEFRDPQRSLDNFDFNFNKKMNRSLVFDLATGAFIARHEDALFLGPPGTGKSHLAQAIGQAAIQQGYRVLYRETHKLLDDLAEATIDGTRKEHMELLASVPLLIIDDLGMRKLPVTAAEELLEIVMRRYERTSTLLTSNRKCGAPHFRFYAEHIVMRTLIPESPLFRYFHRFSRRIKEWIVREAINLSLARKRPDLSLGGVTSSSVSSFIDGSTRV
jgi:DNA replication protein DnaC